MADTHRMLRRITGAPPGRIGARMRRIALAAAVVGIAASVATAVDARPTAEGTEVAIFYYTWWGTPDRDGAWQHWDQAGSAPPATLASSYYPARGPYSSTDPSVVSAQMREIAAAGVDTVVLSWWGPGTVEDERLLPTARLARAAGLSVAVHLEPWPGRTAADTVTAVQRLASAGFHDFYVYDSTLIPDADWAEALRDLEGVRVFANTWLPGRAAQAGFDGLYSYDVLVHDGTSFARVCAAARRLGLVCAPSVGPGFDGRRATPVLGVADRRDGKRYDAMWRAALRARPDVVSITSYNEWHEGTQIEPAATRRAGYATYQGAWGRRGSSASRAYLDRTREWVGRLQAQPNAR
jgi:glycoprotein endo-alpha-1,2-mannosidase